MPKPRRGEVYWLDFEPARGVEQRGRRPGLIVQNDRGNEHASYTVVAALSTAPLARTFPFTVQYEAGEANLPRAGHINCSQLLTIDQSRLDGLIGSFDVDRMLEVDRALRYELDLGSS
jgi:mRNA interferase MazF